MTGGRGRSRGRGRGRGRRHPFKPHREGKVQNPLGRERVDGILAYLRKCGRKPQRAIDIAKACGYGTPREVNPTLYMLSKRRVVRFTNGTPPLWSCHPNARLSPVPSEMLTTMDAMRLGENSQNGMAVESIGQRHVEPASMNFSGGFGGMVVGSRRQAEATWSGESFTPRKVDATLDQGLDSASQQESVQGAVEEEDGESTYIEDYDDMEEESFDINDRIDDLIANSQSNYQYAALSPGTLDSLSSDPDLADQSAEYMVASPASPVRETESPDTELCFRDLVLKTLGNRLLKTGASMVIVSALKSSKESVEEALQDLLKEKLVDRNGTAWMVTSKGDQYLEEKGISGPVKKLQPNVAREKKNFCHPSTKGATQGLPLSPLELLGSNTQYGVKGAGRGQILATIAADIQGLTKRNVHKSPKILTSLGTGSVIGQTDGGPQTGLRWQTRPGGLSDHGATNQPPSSQGSSRSHPGVSSHTITGSLSLVSQGQQGRSSPSFQQQQAAMLQSCSRSLPPTPMDLIQQEQGQVISSGHTLSFVPRGSHDPMSAWMTESSGPQSLPTRSLGGAASVPSQAGGLNSLPCGTLEITTETFAGVNKNPVSALMEYAQSRQSTARIEVISQRGPSHKPKFVLAAFVGSRQFPGVECSNKKDGKKEAADVAMRILLAEGQQTQVKSVDRTLVPSSTMTHFDKIAALTHQAFNQLIATIPDTLAGRKIIAGLVMKRNPEDTGIVISIGSGNRCITGQQLSLEGNTVNDCHAEIITRRGFLRFLYAQLETYEPGRPHDLFEVGPTGKLRIKPGISLHLYISTAPCGDGALFSPRDAVSNRGSETFDRQHHPTFTSGVQGLLRTKMEGGEGTIPVESDFVAQTFDGIQRGERLRTMSCTDKICRWNVVGMQGALLSHFLEPIYLDSLTLGFLYDHGHLARAVCCRVNKSEPPIDTLLPPLFHLNHPWLGRVTACDPPRETQKTKSLSINWCLGDPRPEVLDGPLGLCHTAIEKGFFSRLTKKNLYDSFKKVATRFGRSDLLETETYYKAKMMAVDFQTAKSIMLKKFKENKYGPWVSKPVEEEMFCWWDASSLHLQNKPVEGATWGEGNPELLRQTEVQACSLLFICSMSLRLAMYWLSLVLQIVTFVRNGNNLVRSQQDLFALNYFVLFPHFDFFIIDNFTLIIRLFVIGILKNIAKGLPCIFAY
uniref:Double-stranded RNA-specific adenosine deaminase 1 n=1 Tax=Haliotis diversicolor TaxID=36095 RepID=A0A5B7L1W7_HALDV|nr:double-stranded RNA-specific adenosine deaminase 1 [Haliotis diversicolor]